MRSFYLLLMLLCGCCCCWTGGAANLMHLDGTKLSGSGSAAQFEKLRDGSLEEAFLASPLLGSVIRIELPEARKIDHLLLATAGGPDWSIARRISLRLDDGDTIMLEFPNHFRHAERFDVRRTARVLELKVEEVYAASPESAGSSKVVRPWGGFAEIEVNDAEDIPLMVEAIPLPGESIMLVITKVEDPEELDTRFSKFSPYGEDSTDMLASQLATEFLEGAQASLEYLGASLPQGAAERAARRKLPDLPL